MGERLRTIGGGRLPCVVPRQSELPALAPEHPPKALTARLSPRIRQYFQHVLFPGCEFYSSALFDYVRAGKGLSKARGESILRIARKLRQDLEIDFVCIDRARSKYKVPKTGRPA